MNLYAVYLVRFDGANPIYYVYKQGLIDGYSKNTSFWGVQACRLGKRGTFWSRHRCRIDKRGTFRGWHRRRIGKWGLIGVVPVGVAAEAGAVWPVAGVGVRRL